MFIVGVSCKNVHLFYLFIFPQNEDFQGNRAQDDQGPPMKRGRFDPRMDEDRVSDDFYLI